MVARYSKRINIIFISLLSFVFTSCGPPRYMFQKTHYSSYDIKQVGQYEQPCSGPTFIDPRDSTAYNTIQIGDQCWIKENLKWLPEISDLRKWSHIEPNYFVYDFKRWGVSAAKETENYKNYGVLYNWPAAITACPPGWRLPDVEDWKELKSYLVNSYEEINYLNIGTVLRSCRQRRSSLGGDCNTRIEPNWPSNKYFIGTDEFGFSALPGGYKGENHTFHQMGSAGYWWTFNSITPTHAIAYSLTWEPLQLGKVEKTGGVSVRCIMDEGYEAQNYFKSYEIDTVAYMEWAEELQSMNRKTGGRPNLNLPNFMLFWVASPALSIGATIFLVGGSTAAGIASAAIGISTLYGGVKILNHRERIRRNHYIKLEEESWIKEVKH